MPQRFVALAELVLIERLNPKINKRRWKSGFAAAAFDRSPLMDVLRRTDIAKAPPQRNAGSDPSSSDSPVSETPSSLGPRR